MSAVFGPAYYVTVLLVEKVQRYADIIGTTLFNCEVDWEIRSSSPNVLVGPLAVAAYIIPVPGRECSASFGGWSPVLSVMGLGAGIEAERPSRNASNIFSIGLITFCSKSNAIYHGVAGTQLAPSRRPAKNQTLEISSSASLQGHGDATFRLTVRSVEPNSHGPGPAKQS